jgi:MarR family transcriptional regulator, lower aerobic nicotinate degradation pathway regulator
LVSRTNIVRRTYYCNYARGMGESPTDQPSSRDARVGPDLGIVDALVQISFLIQGALARYAAGHDLSLIQTRLLGVLRDREPTMQGLSKLLNLDKSSVTGLVDRAERRGLVRRTPALDDRRTIRVSLTPSGRRLVGAVADAFATDVRSATASLSEEERRQLSILATRVVYEHWASASRQGQRESVQNPDDISEEPVMPFRIGEPPGS